MLFSDITVLNEEYKAVGGQYVATAGSKIIYVGDEKPAGNFEREINGSGRLLMSGFYNAHAHSPMTLMRGYGENLSLHDWLNTRIFPFEAHLDGNAVYWGTVMAMAESLKYGIVSTSDMYYLCDDMARAVEETGAKANISRSITNFSGKPIETQASWTEMDALYKKWHNRINGRVKVDMSLHAEYTSDAATAEALAEYAKSLDDVIMQIHVSETASEHADCIKRHGMTPAAYLADAGLFDVPAVAAHCVHVTDDDLCIFRDKGVTVATSPVSNMKLASGICDADRVRKKGVNLAIGTDSVASNNSLNFFEEMKVLAIGNKVLAGNPTAMTPVEILRAATEGGAKAQGRTGGTVSEGMDADLIVVNVSAINMYPVHNMANNLVYSCSGDQVEMTVVDGRVLYEKGEFTTIDIEKTIFEVDRATERILGKL